MKEKEKLFVVSRIDIDTENFGSLAEAEVVYSGLNRERAEKIYESEFRITRRNYEETLAAYSGTKSPEDGLRVREEIDLDGSKKRTVAIGGMNGLASVPLCMAIFRLDAIDTNIHE